MKQDKAEASNVNLQCDANDRIIATLFRENRPA